MVFDRYSQLRTPDGSKSELTDETRKYGHHPNMQSRELPSDDDIEEDEEASKSTIVVEVDPGKDYLGCGGMLGPCPIFWLLAFVLVGIGAGVGFSLLMVCAR